MKTGYFFDMDGTLYSNAFHSVSTKTFEALKQLQAQGNPVFLATSRTHQELLRLPEVMRTFPFDARIQDGGSMIEGVHQEILLKQCMDVDLMKEFDAYCKKENIVYRYSTQDGNYWGTKPKLEHHQIYYDLYLSAPVYKPYDDDEVLNILAFVDLDKQKEILAMMSDCGVVCFDEVMELRAKGIDKITAVQFLKEKFQLDRTVCFGDGHNDIEMLKNADVGIAMGNACDPLKEVADQVIGNVDEDGIYHYLVQEGIVKEVE